MARCLADSNNTSAALKAAIRAVCETQQWDSGRYFRLDPVAGLLYLDASCGLPMPAVTLFMEKSRDAVFRLGAGLASRFTMRRAPSPDFTVLVLARS